MNVIDTLFKNNRNKGFTLVELIAVITILGILILLATPNFLDNTRNVSGKEILNNVRFVDYKLQMYEVKNEADAITSLSLVEIDRNDIQEAYEDERVFNKDGYAYIDYLEGFYDLSGTEISQGIHGSTDGRYAIKANEIYFIADKNVNVAIDFPEDTDPPIITVGSYPTTPTNGDVTVCTSTNEGYLNQDCHTFTENGSFEFIATDLAGNKTYEIITIDFIDKLAPTITINPDGDITKKKAHTATIEIEDKPNEAYSSNSVAESGWAWSTNPNATYESLTWSSMVEDGGVEIDSTTGDYFLYAYAVDTVGNFDMIRSSNPFSVDNTPPVITVEAYNTSITNQDVVVSASTNEGSLNSASHVFTENGSFTFIATDEAGNTSSETVTIINIDKTPPVITIGAYNTAPTNQNITVTASTNEGTLNSASHVFSVNGNYTFIASDEAGNTSSKTITITNIDKIPPVITIGTYNTAPTNQDITVTASTNEGTINSANHVFTENGSFTFIATDEAGNIGSETVTITNIDKVPPVITIGAYSTAWTNQNITVTASTDKGTLNAISYTFTSNESFLFRAEDAAGNVTNRNVTISNIDKTAPTISSFGGNSTTKSTHTMAVPSIADTGGSGLSTRQYAWSTSTATPTTGWINISGSSISGTFTSNRYLHIRATDNAGNVTTARSTAVFAFGRTYDVYTINYVSTFYSTTVGNSCGLYSAPSGGIYLYLDIIESGGRATLYARRQFTRTTWSSASAYKYRDTAGADFEQVTSLSAGSGCGGDTSRPCYTKCARKFNVTGFGSNPSRGSFVQTITTSTPYPTDGPSGSNWYVLK